MKERDIAIQITDLKKQYRLGVIGGRTLQADIQSFFAKVRKKEDPNKKFGQKTYGKNETFLALNDINLTVYKGERLGIIGHNGAGKSTLLKVLSRVTAPTEGRICIDGRISSILEVGTGFNPELTGRENIYLNGAILGMTRAEVDSKIKEIIEFSECEKFIDTPAKRYSSGMFVKLAFAVAAHLDSEILVMDEVLAVGDMKFQQKCLGKMSDVSSTEGKTVLYVSHNMSTIRQLCERCIVLDHGKKIYDGDVEEAIALYSDIKRGNMTPKTDLKNAKRKAFQLGSRQVLLSSAEFLDKEENIFTRDEKAKLRLTVESHVELKHPCLRITLKDMYERRPGTMVCTDLGPFRKGENTVDLELDLHELSNGIYGTNISIFDYNEYGTVSSYDEVLEGFYFEVNQENDFLWNQLDWGSMQLARAKVIR